jgi:uncharacterized protein YbaA (DUF1428 family)
MRYVDRYILPVPKKNVRAYRRMAEKASKIWREHGALAIAARIPTLSAGGAIEVRPLMPSPEKMKSR